MLSVSFFSVFYLFMLLAIDLGRKSSRMANRSKSLHAFTIPEIRGKTCILLPLVMTLAVRFYKIPLRSWETFYMAHFLFLIVKRELSIFFCCMTAFQISDKFHITKINPIWPSHMIIFIHCFTQFSSTLLRILLTHIQNSVVENFKKQSWKFPTFANYNCIYIKVFYLFWINKVTSLSPGTTITKYHDLNNFSNNKHLFIIISKYLFLLVGFPNSGCHYVQVYNEDPLLGFRSKVFCLTPFLQGQ